MTETVDFIAKHFDNPYRNAYAAETIHQLGVDIDEAATLLEHPLSLVTANLYVVDHVHDGTVYYHQGSALHSIPWADTTIYRTSAYLFNLCQRYAHVSHDAAAGLTLPWLYELLRSGSDDTSVVIPDGSTIPFANAFDPRMREVVLPCRPSTL
ncbi:MAG: hypothetical protein RQ731_08040 [Anaerosomatales bacterium]|nr:hypothetical protein [Anaerosomatales bacterium]